MPHRSRRPLLAAATALLFAFAALLVVPAQAVTNGTISGTVTKTGGLSVGDGYLTAHKASDPDAYPVQGNIMNGTYALSLAPGDYLLRYQAGGGEDILAPEWWDDSPTRGGATSITVVSGEIFTADVELPLAGSISGHIATNHPTFGYLDTEVTTYQADPSYPGGWRKSFGHNTDEDGNYTLNYLPAGEYRLHYYSQLTHYEGWWPDATSLEGATSIMVAAGDVITGIDPVLTPDGTISGKAVTTSGTPVANVVVTLFHDWGHGFLAVSADHWGSTTTASDGTFTLHAPADSYKVKFTPSTASRLRTEYWNNSTKLALATSVAVTPGTSVTGINGFLEKNLFTLTSAASITGTLKVGQYLRAVPPRSVPTPTTVTFQWYRSGKPIIGTAAKKSIYKLTAADRYRKIGVKITLSRAGYYPLSRYVTRSATVQ